MTATNKKKLGSGSGRPVQWSHAEDDALRKLVAEHGTKKWTLIASLLKTKHSKQCRRRWKNGLSVKMKSCEWSTEEDRILFDRQTELGNRWTEIAKSLPGRTDNAVKNRFLALSKKVDQATHLASWSSDSATSRLSEGQALDEELKIQVPQAQQSTPKVPASTFLDVLDGRELQETFEIPLESVFPLDQQPSRRAEALNMVNDLPVDVLSFW